MHTVFGIRHHGPGSAKHLRRALEALQPDCVLIEAPADGASALPYLVDAKIKYPIALLVYNPKNFEQATYVPFARFSPEWGAIQYAQEREIPVQFMDLPMSMHFGMQLQKLPKLQFGASEEDVQLLHDPIGHLARLAGYTDSERWWEVTFERAADETEIFAAIGEMMRTLRAELRRTESDETLRREAFMRKTLRKAIKDGYENIAVVCGAWHAPVLEDWMAFPQKNDNAILRGIKKVKTANTWIPWSYERLSYRTGYGAGVLSPAWYDMLFSRPKQATTRWMVRAARLMRQENWDASAAHALEAVRLAETLARLRNLSIPGIEELKEAAITVLAEGSEAQLALIEERLVVGNQVGKIKSAGMPVVPLQKDLEQQIKSARLTKYQKTTDVEWLKATSTNPRGGIDLREPTDRLKSHVLHRLRILNINWGEPQEGGKFDTGSFKEYWKLKWKPEFLIRVIEASVWGNTLELAATTVIQKKVEGLQELKALTAAFEQALHAGLSAAIPFLLAQLQQVSAETEDVLLLADALSPLVRILRYDNVRQTDTEAVQALVHELVPRICVGLPNACTNIDEELGQEVLEKLKTIHHALQILQEQDYLERWYHALHKLLQLANIQAQIKGVATRLLFDKRQLSLTATQREMHFQLSLGNTPNHAAQWIEGFLQGSGLLLIHNPELWKIVDDWVRQLTLPDFQQILPMLRRAFANFSAAEREKMLQLVQHGIPNQSTARSSTTSTEEIAAIRETVGLLLGW